MKPNRHKGKWAIACMKKSTANQRYAISY